MKAEALSPFLGLLCSNVSGSALGPPGWQESELLCLNSATSANGEPACTETPGGVISLSLCAGGPAPCHRRRHRQWASDASPGGGTQRSRRPWGGTGAVCYLATGCVSICGLRSFGQVAKGGFHICKELFTAAQPTKARGCAVPPFQGSASWDQAWCKVRSAGPAPGTGSVKPASWILSH